jgi:hypothetical protein
MDVQWLAGEERPWVPYDLQVTQHPHGGGRIVIFAYRDAVKLDGEWIETSRDITYAIPPLKAGSYELAYYAAPRRELGGMFLSFALPVVIPGNGVDVIPIFDEAVIDAATTTYGPIDPITQTFTVLP